MSAARIVIVVLNWNGRLDSLACLRSLSRLNPSDHELLFVDNGSSDGSEAAVRAAFPMVQVLQTGSNLGFAGGNNTGIRWALERGADHVLLLNNDTEVEPDFLDQMLECANEDPKIGIVGAAIAYFDRPERLWAFGGGRFDVATGWVRHVQRPLEDAALRTRGTLHFYITGCAMLLSRELLETVGGLDTGYFHFCEDVDLCLRAEAAGFRCAVAPAARLVHKVSATTKVGSPTFLYYNLRSRLRLISRFGAPNSPRTWPLFILWLRLWRPAVEAGMPVAGFKALRRAARDFRAGYEGPAPRELSSSSNES
ncbi:MAG TPA: glycosyltransferase family 2 protein [Candidatus Krumholzibacteria bacterium]